MSLWKDLLSDPQAFRTLIACTLAMVTCGLEPAYLTLSTPEVQNQLRNPDAHAPMYIALGFLLVALLTLAAGTSGDLFGRKVMLVGALVWLTIANLFGALTLGTPQFILADLIGTVTAAMVIPMCVALVTLAFPPSRRPLAFGILFGMSSVAIIIGGALGALFEMLGIPRAAFIPVVIVGILTIRLVVKNVPESRAQKGFRRSSAVINLVLLMSIFVFIYLAIAAQKSLIGWLPVLVAGSILLTLVAFLRWLRQRVRFFNGVEMYTGRDTGFAMLAGVVLFIGYGALFYQLSAFFQTVQGLSPFLAGVAFAPFVVGILVGTGLIPWLAVRMGARRIIVIGLALMSVSLVLFAFIQVDTSYWLLLVPMALAGIGFGVANPARTQLVLSTPPLDLLGSAAAVNTAVGQSGYGLGVILSSLLITSTADSLFLAPLKSIGLSETTLHQIEAALPSIFARTASGDYPNLPQAIVDLASSSYDQAFTIAMGRMFLAMAVTMVVAGVLIYIGMHRNLRLEASPLRKPEPPADEEPADAPPL